MKRGQASMEFLVIVGFVFLMIIPLVIIFLEQSAYVKDAISQNHIRNIAVKLTDKAETVYYLGGSSKTTIKALFPKGIEDVNLTGKSITFWFRNSENNLRSITSVCAINITGNISVKPGVHLIQIESAGDSALLKEI
jgi:uncharacterized protein (UPF0333 family)